MGGKKHVSDIRANTFLLKNGLIVKGRLLKNLLSIVKKVQMKCGWVCRTRHLAAVGHSHGTEAVVGHGCDLPSAPSPVVVVALAVWMRHRVWVVGVQVVAALWTLRRTEKKFRSCVSQGKPTFTNLVLVLQLMGNKFD